MPMLSEAEAERTIAQLERGYVLEALEALTLQGHDEETLTLFASFFDDARLQTPMELDHLHGTIEGDLIAATITKIQRLQHMTQPVAAGGWRKVARISLTVALTITGWLSAPASTSLAGSVLGACIGLIIGSAIGYFRLGGRPETRHALAQAMKPASQRGWRAIRDKLSPSPHSEALERARAASSGEA